MNLEGGISTGMTGAQVGGQVGGGWGAVAGAAIGFVVGAANDPDKHLKKRTEEYNRQVTKNVAHSLFDLERQRISERMRTTSAMLGYNAQRSTTLSSLRAQYGAIDVIGSSTNALKQAYAFQLDQAIAQEYFNFDVGIDNYNTNVMQVVNQGLGQLRYDYKQQNQQSMSPDMISGMLQKGMSMFGGKGSGNTGVSNVTGVIGDNGQVSYGFGSSGGSLGIA